MFPNDRALWFFRPNDLQKSGNAPAAHHGIDVLPIIGRYVFLDETQLLVLAYSVLRVS